MPPNSASEDSKTQPEFRVFIPAIKEYSIILGLLLVFVAYNHVYKLVLAFFTLEFQPFISVLTDFR